MDYYIRNSATKNKFKKKLLIDEIVKNIFLAITLICASIIIVIVLFITIKGVSPFLNYYDVGGVMYNVNLSKFIVGSTWFTSPNIYGIGFIILNTVYIVVLAILIAVPCSILTSLFIAKIAYKKIGNIVITINEMLASIPSIVYGVFGFGMITKLVKVISSIFNYQSAGGISTLSTVLVLAIMIIPSITMISTTAIKAVKSDVEWGSYALGASKRQTNFKVVFASAKSGIFAGIILGVGRALGEATAVSMVAGNSGSGPNFNLFDTTRTLTSTMLLGLKETTGLDYDIRFSVGIVLIILILITNYVLNSVKKKVGNSYE